MSVVLVTGTTLAGAAEPALEIAVEGEDFEVGDPVSVRIQARGGEESLWGDLEIEAKDEKSWALVSPTREIPGSRPPAWEVVLAALKTGEIEAPTFSVGLRDADGQVLQVVAADVPTLTIASVLTEGDAAPAPLIGPLGVDGFPWEWALPIGLLLTPLVVAGAWMWRRRGRRGTVAGDIPRLPPFGELQQLLEALASRVGTDSAAQVCDRLAGGVRRYLERRTGEPAAEMTSHELRLLARKAGWPSSMQSSLQQVTAVADGVRFGRRAVRGAELLAACESASQVGSELEHHLEPKVDAQEIEA